MSARRRAAVSIPGVVAVLLIAVGPVPARADTPEETFIEHIKRSNEVASPLPGTPEQWVQAGYTTCGRVSSRIAQGQVARAAINDEVGSARVMHHIDRQSAVALVTYAVLDLCPQVAAR